MFNSNINSAVKRNDKKALNARKKLNKIMDKITATAVKRNAFFQARLIDFRKRTLDFQDRMAFYQDKRLKLERLRQQMSLDSLDLSKESLKLSEKISAQDNYHMSAWDKMLSKYEEYVGIAGVEIAKLRKRNMELDSIDEIEIMNAQITYAKEFETEELKNIGFAGDETARNSTNTFRASTTLPKDDSIISHPTTTLDFKEKRIYYKNLEKKMAAVLKSAKVKSKLKRYRNYYRNELEICDLKDLNVEGMSIAMIIFSYRNKREYEEYQRCKSSIKRAIEELGNIKKRPQMSRFERIRRFFKLE